MLFSRHTGLKGVNIWVSLPAVSMHARCISHSLVSPNRCYLQSLWHRLLCLILLLGCLRIKLPLEGRLGLNSCTFLPMVVGGVATIYFPMPQAAFPDGQSHPSQLPLVIHCLVPLTLA